MESTQSLDDIAYRSRRTILKMLDQRGYNTTPYENFGPDEIAVLLNNPSALNMILTSKDDESKKVNVYYHFNRMKLSLSTFVKNLVDAEDANGTPESRLDPTTTEVIVITMEQIVDAFHAAALEAWTAHKLRIQFFWMPSLVNYPLDHILQPKFEKVPTEEHQELLKSLYVRSKAQFPLIKYHSDMAARCLGLVPGDLVKIIRPSPSAGEYILYRVCVP